MNANENPWTNGGQAPSWAQPYGAQPGGPAGGGTPGAANGANWQAPGGGANPGGARMPQYGARMGAYGKARAVQGFKSRTTAGILAIVLGAFGVHKFYMEYPHAGLLMVLLTVLTGGALGPIVQAVGIVEGIIYLTMPEERFQETYIRHEKKWF